MIGSGEEEAAFSQICPRCGEELSGGDRETVADDVIVHARDAHNHNLDRYVVLAHLEGINPHDFEE